MAGLGPADSITGERLRKLRAKLGWSIQRVAHTLSVSPTLVTAWENGRSSPSAVYLRSLAVLYGASLDEIAGDGAAKRFETDWPEGWSVLHRAGEALSPHKRDAVVKIVEAILDADEAEKKGAGGGNPSEKRN